MKAIFWVLLAATLGIAASMLAPALAIPIWATTMAYYFGYVDPIVESAPQTPPRIVAP